MPLLISTFVHKLLDSLLPTFFEAIPKLTTAGAQTTTEVLLVGRHGGPWLVVRHSQLIEGLPGACFGFSPRR